MNKLGIRQRRIRRGAKKINRTNRLSRFERLERRNLLTTFVVTSLSDVTTDGLTFREAIEAASFDRSVDGSPAGSAVDVIQFREDLFSSGPQTITLQPSLHLGTSFSGDSNSNGSEVPAGALLVDGSFTNVSINSSAGGSISIIGPGADLLTIDAGGSEAIFVVDDQVNISGLSLTGSKYTSGDLSGRAIITDQRPDPLGNLNPANPATALFADSSLLTLAGVHIHDNEGGGIYHGGGGLIIRESTIENNGFASATINASFGGGILAQSSYTLGSYRTTAIIEDSLIRGNKSSSGGAGIANEG